MYALYSVIIVIEVYTVVSLYSTCTLGTVGIFLYVNNSEIRLPATTYSMLCWVRPDFLRFAGLGINPLLFLFESWFHKSKILYVSGRILHPESQTFLWWVRFDFSKK